LACFGLENQTRIPSLLTLTSISAIPTDHGPTAVTIGKFDCIHLGHQALFTEIVDAATNLNLVPTVVTFDRHPDHLLRPERAKLPILGPTRKADLISGFGIATMLQLEFNQELADLSPEQFVKQILVQGLKAKRVLVGEGFRFGNQGSGNFELLKALGDVYGFEVSEVKRVQVDGEVVSTTLVRELLDLGNVKLVNKMLGRVHEVSGMVEHGLKIGRKIGFPTANIARDAEGYLPLDGVYAGWLIADGIRYPAAHSVGINETFQAVPRLVESHVLDETELDLYDKVVSLEFVDFVRPAAKFDGVEALVKQINLDLDVVRNQLGL
jgi:riboflavin kinase / FMN adenylyltransferase